MRTRKQITLHLDLQIADALEIEAMRRGLNSSRAANDILRRVLVDEATEKIADTVKARLDRLDRREETRAKEMAVIKESVLLFVRTWFLHVDPLEGDDPDLEANAEARYTHFLQRLVWEIERPTQR